MLHVTQRIRKHPLAWFYALAILIEIALVPVFLLSGAAEALEAGIAKSGISFNTDLVTAARLFIAAPETGFAIMLSVAQVAAPDLAVLLVGLALPHTVLYNLKARLRFAPADMPIRRAITIWVSCIALFCAMNLATAFLHMHVLQTDGFVWAMPKTLMPLAIGLVIAMFLDGGGLLEENAWRGFAQPILQQRHGPLLGTLSVGVMWAFWHFPVKFDLLEYGSMAIVIAAVLTVKFVLLSIVMTYFWNKLGGTTMIAIAMHGLSNDSVRIGGFVDAPGATAYLISEFALIAPILCVACVIIIATRGRLGAPTA
jgi:uncharacterized protein